ncbi:DUF1826 domain-containing protein [Prosthecobacter sp.]|uniref:DUF1826 domain-containing protein n=1 Tax=Prosthecobacter sp. TaxID=1965333 RepID=UPI0037852E2F
MTDLPHDYRCIRLVGSFEELVMTPFGDGINALCWPRELPGDFGEIVEKLQVGRGITSLDEARLLALDLSDAGQVAREILLRDQKLLRDRELQPSLDCINGYVNEIESELLRTDVQSWHVDSATVEADTYLCTYSGACSEGLPNEEAVRRVDVPELRAQLLRLYGGEDDEGFREWLNENYLDLHYTALPQARPFSFGLGHLWRIATEWPGSPVPPCVHRAPETVAGRPARLLLIS